MVELSIADFPEPPDTTSPPVLAAGHRVPTESGTS